MGNLVLIRKVSESVRVYNAAKTRFYEMEIKDIGKEGVILQITVSDTTSVKTIKIDFNTPQKVSEGAIEIQSQGRRQCKMLFDFSRDINVVRAELVK